MIQILEEWTRVMRNNQVMTKTQELWSMSQLTARLGVGYGAIQRENIERAVIGDGVFKYGADAAERIAEALREQKKGATDERRREIWRLDHSDFFEIPNAHRSKRPHYRR